MAGLTELPLRSGFLSIRNIPVQPPEFLAPYGTFRSGRPEILAHTEHSDPAALVVLGRPANKYEVPQIRGFPYGERASTPAW